MTVAEILLPELLNLCIRDLQTVKTQMKCCIMLHFIRVHIVCKGKVFQTKGCNIFF